MLGDEHPDVGSSLSGLGRLLLLEGDYTEAEPILKEALDIRTKALGNEHPDIVSDLVDLAVIAEADGDLSAADFLLERSARAYDAARTRVAVGVERSTFLESPYPHLAAVRLEAEKTDLAWAAAEKAQARSLADLLMMADARELSADETSRQDSLKNVLGTLEQHRRLSKCRRERHDWGY